MTRPFSFLLAFLISMNTLASAEQAQNFRAFDGAYSLKLDTDYKQVSKQKKSLTVILPSQAFYIVNVTASGTPHNAEKVKELWPKQVKGTVLSSATGKVGGRDAAYFVLEGVFVPQKAQLKDMGRSSNTKFQTVMAIIPSQKQTYIFQAHYPEDDSETGRKLALMIFNTAVQWHR